MKADWKAAWRRLEAEDWVALLLMILLAVGMGLVTLGGRCLACGLESQGTSSLLSTLAQSLSAIFAIAFSVTLVALQLAATAYTPRILRLHTWHPYFVGLFVTYLVTIGYLFLLAAGHSALGPDVRLYVDVGLVLSIFSLAYLAPFTAHSVRLLTPANIVRALLRKIGRDDFAPNGNPREKLQPIEDLIIKAIREDHHQTAREGLRLLTARFLTLCQPTGEKMEVYFLAGPFVDFLERVARFCAQGRDFEMMGEVLAQFQRLSQPLVERGRGPAVDYVDAALGKIEFTAQEWFDEGKSGVEMARVEMALADVRAALAKIMR